MNPGGWSRITPSSWSSRSVSIATGLPPRLWAVALDSEGLAFAGDVELKRITGGEDAHPSSVNE